MMNIKQGTKNEITAAFILFSLLLALLCIDTMLSGEGFWYVLYFGVVIANTIPLGLLIGRLLSTFIVWCWSDPVLNQLTSRLISATRQRPKERVS
jgi:NhaP-type Na+/H+ or K+/H+ antiporter